MNSRERELIKREDVLGGYDPDKYQSERIFATAATVSNVSCQLFPKP